MFLKINCVSQDPLCFSKFIVFLKTYCVSQDSMCLIVQCLSSLCINQIRFLGNFTSNTKIKSSTVKLNCTYFCFLRLHLQILTSAVIIVNLSNTTGFHLDRISLGIDVIIFNCACSFEGISFKIIRLLRI